MRAHRIALSLLLLLQVAAGPLAATSRVLSVSDGDSLWISTPEGKRVEVRLAEIDCPEGGQPYGDRARAELESLVLGKYVRLEPRDVDRYGRTVARVYAGAVDVNAELVRRGAAWVYLEYLQDESLPALEKAARAEKRGLWALPKSERIPPWKWRRTNGRHGRSGDSTSAPRVTCGRKTKCSEMKSCEEARQYLERCGETRLDGDRDGVPCRSLCR